MCVNACVCMCAWSCRLTGDEGQDEELTLRAVRASAPGRRGVGGSFFGERPLEPRPNCPSLVHGTVFSLGHSVVSLGHTHK